MKKRAKLLEERDKIDKESIRLNHKKEWVEEMLNILELKRKDITEQVINS